MDSQADLGRVTAIPLRIPRCSKPDRVYSGCASERYDGGWLGRVGFCALCARQVWSSSRDLCPLIIHKEFFSPFMSLSIIPKEQAEDWLRQVWE